MGAEAVGLPPDGVRLRGRPAASTSSPRKELGMATVLHTDAAQTIVQLEELLGVALT